MTRQFVDEADWDGVELVRTKVGAGGIHCNDYKRQVYDRYVYSSREERLLAEMLTYERILFVPDVAFNLGPVQGQRTHSTFVPDFVFDDHPFIWTGDVDDGKPGAEPVLIHGIEAKGSNGRGEFSPLAQDNIARLWHLRRIRILLLDNDDIRRYHSLGWLPMRRITV